MCESRIVFAQLMDYLPREVFDTCVEKYRGNYNHKGFTCRDQFLAMAFAQLTLRDGLRGIQDTLEANRHDVQGLYAFLEISFRGCLLADNGYWPKRDKRVELEEHGITVKKTTGQ